MSSRRSARPGKAKVHRLSRANRSSRNRIQPRHDRRCRPARPRSHAGGHGLHHRRRGLRREDLHARFRHGTRGLPRRDARELFQSIRRLLSLPDETRLFLCHDYKAPGRDEYAWETTVGQQRRENVHVKDGTTEEEFVAMRTSRDKTLAMPDLIMPSVQVNIRGGRLPEPEANGVSYIKIPVNAV